MICEVGALTSLKRFFGIDFGTTNSAIAGVLQSRYGISSQEYGDRDGNPFPSLVAVDRLTGEVYCGRSAWQRRLALAENCEIIPSVKSLLGTDHLWNIRGEVWTPERVAAEILGALKQRVQDRNGVEMKEAVIAVPVGFSARQRASLREAARLAGIRVKSFVSESTAAIFKNYDILKGFSKIGVFDWGGGTLDVSVVENRQGRLYELAVDGMPVAGDHIDQMLARWIHGRACSDRGLTISFDELPPQFKDTLLVRAEKAKRDLSDDNSTSISFNYAGIGVVNIQIDIDTFSKLIEPVVDRALFTFERAVRNAGINVEALDCVLVTGGSSNLRLLIEKMENRWSNLYCEFPEEPDWVAAHGAALLSTNPGSFRLNQDIGLVLSDDSFFPLFRTHERLPCSEQVYEFGVVEDSKTARFLFSDGGVLPGDQEHRILGYSEVPAYGFRNEILQLNSYIDEDLVFHATIRSDHMPAGTTRTFEYSRLRFYYDLPRIGGDTDDARKS